jgi:zinc/manganese transport system substrate-binding protein
MSSPVHASSAKIKVVATTSDLAALVERVGAEHIDCVAIAKGTQDPHQIEAKPSFMLKMRDADLVVSQGLELESAWLRPLVDGARNPKIAPTLKGFLELGSNLSPIDVPIESVSREQGDVHPGGNPHFQLDPIRMGDAAVLLAKRLAEIDPKNSDVYIINAKSFKSELGKKTLKWQERIKKSGVANIVSYHKTFSYFLDRFGLKSVASIEPKPGIPPTASHLKSVIDSIKKNQVKLVLIENYFDNSAADRLRQENSQLVVVKAPVSVGGEPELKTTEQLIEKLVVIVESVGQK